MQTNSKGKPNKLQGASNHSFTCGCLRSCLLVANVSNVPFPKAPSSTWLKVPIALHSYSQRSAVSSMRLGMMASSGLPEAQPNHRPSESIQASPLLDLSVRDPLRRWAWSRTFRTFQHARRGRCAKLRLLLIPAIHSLAFPRRFMVVLGVLGVQSYFYQFWATPEPKKRVF